MATLPKTGINTPTENNNPFIVEFDGTFGVGLDDWIDANSSDLKTFIHTPIPTDVPTFSSGTGLVTWGNFTINSSRCAGVLNVVAGSIAIADGQCFYVDIPTRPFAGQTVVPGVINIPRIERDRLVLGMRLGNVFYKFGLIYDVVETKRVVDYTASALLTAASFEGVHRVDHATNAIDLTLPVIEASMVGKSAKILKWGAGDAAFVAGAANYIADGSAGGRLENTVGTREAKIAFAIVTAVSLTEYSVEFMGGWQTT